MGWDAFDHIIKTVNIPRAKTCVIIYLEKAPTDFTGLLNCPDKPENTP
jgi:hypothetical protein